MAILMLTYKCLHPATHNGQSWTTDRKVYKEIAKQLCPACQDRFMIEASK